MPGGLLGMGDGIFGDVDPRWGTLGIRGTHTIEWYISFVACRPAWRRAWVFARSVTGGWSNYPSAEEEHEELLKLVADAHQKGFCTFYNSVEEAERDIGAKPIFNKLGVIVKIKETGKKARIISHLRESKVNTLCNPAERIILLVGIGFHYGCFPRGRQHETPLLWCPRFRIRIFSNVVGKVRSIYGKISFFDCSADQSSNLCGRPNHHIWLRGPRAPHALGNSVAVARCGWLFDKTFKSRFWVFRKMDRGYPPSQWWW